MRFSVWPTLQQPWSEVVAVARHADTTGWDGVWLADHFLGDGGGFGPVETPTLEVTAALAALGPLTERVRLGSLVLGTTYRHPAVVANWAATADHVCGGRLVLGVGAGWQQNEHDQYGIELPPLPDRVDRFAEACAVMRGLLHDGRTTFDGRWFQLTDAICEPRPVQPRLPLLIGGKGDRMLGVVARLGDEWNMWGLPSTIAARGAALEARCEQVGRDPREIARSTQALVLLTDDRAAARRFVEGVAPRAAVAGPVSALTDVVGAWRKAGVDEVIVPDAALGRGQARLDALDAIVEQVAPAFRP